MSQLNHTLLATLLSSGSRHAFSLQTSLRHSSLPSRSSRRILRRQPSCVCDKGKLGLREPSFSYRTRLKTLTFDTAQQLRNGSSEPTTHTHPHSLSAPPQTVSAYNKARKAPSSLCRSQSSLLFLASDHSSQLIQLSQTPPHQPSHPHPHHQTALRTGLIPLSRT